MIPPTDIKIVLSDLHMGTGEEPGIVNPWEDFHHDDRLAELILHHAQGDHADCPVELILNGDVLDLLKVTYRGRFEVEVTEAIAVDKVRRCILGHPRVFDALAEFLRAPRHTITYIAGNHDQDIAFPLVQKMIRARVGAVDDPARLRFAVDQEFLRLPGGVVVAHGHGYEIMNRVEAGRALVDLPDGRRIVNLPYGSQFFMEVLAPFKAEQPLVDLVHPLSSMILWGLVFDLRVTVRILLAMARFFLTTRVRRARIRENGFLKTLQVLFEEFALFNNLERRAFRLLRRADDIATLIVGHSHTAKVRRFPRNKVYVNTGTWVKMVSLDLRDLGTRTFLTYARIEYRPSGAPSVRLMRWRGRPREMEEVVA